MKARYLSVLICLILFTSCSQNPVSEFDRLGLEEITIDELQQGFQSGSYTITEVTEAYLERIEAIDNNGPALNSILELNPDAVSIAQQLDQELKEGITRGPMHGVPVILKDNIDTHDKMSTTAGAIALKGSKPLQDSYIVTKLRESGAVILGKANLSEWANFHSSFSSSGWSGMGGQTRNPYDITRNPCGSSAGSGVAVSANLTILAIGTETNGSIVCPSNNNGIVGIKPTVGLLSRSGIIPISFTQDTPGPMTRTVKDAAISLGAMVGVDDSDSKTQASVGHSYTDYTQFLDPDALSGKRIGVYKAPLGGMWRVDTLFNQTVRFLKDNGVTIIELDEISEESPGSASFNVLLYEFKDGLNKYFESLGPDSPVKDLDDLIAQTLADSVEMKYFDHDLLISANKKGDLNSQEYKDALEKLLRITRDEGIDKVMDEHQLDAIIAPTGGPAWKTDLTNGDNFGIGSSSPSARAGYPNITVPMGNIDGLPVGISFFGRAWSEPVLISIAYAFEQKTKARIVPQFKTQIH